MKFKAFLTMLMLALAMLPTQAAIVWGDIADDAVAEGTTAVTAALPIFGFLIGLGLAITAFKRMRRG